MANKGKYYMTTAIAYTSGKPHIAHANMRSFLRTQSQDINVQKVTMSISRQEPTSMDRKFRRRQKQLESHRRLLLMKYPQR